MRKVLAIMVVAGCLVSAANAQESSATGGVFAKPSNQKKGKPTSRALASVRITKQKPSVYLTFERKGTRSPLYEGESNLGIWLRLHNNTRWTIIFPAFGVPEALGQVGMFYEIEEETSKKKGPDLPTGYRPGHLYSSYYLRPGASVVFSIPREHLAEGLALRLSFSYEWEDQDDVFAGREVKHQVYFSSSDRVGSMVRN